MASRHIDNTSQLTSALSGMSLALSIASDATDAMPAVKQVLSVAVRVVAFAEKIDKDREALHRLVERSLQLAQRVTDVMSGRAPNARISSSLSRIHSAFDNIAAFIKKHSERGRLCQTIGYVFTVPQQVERLSRELGDAEQELILVTLLDVNHQQLDGSQYDGEFRLLHHCDVEKLDLIKQRKHCTNGTNVVVRYHKARVNKELCVVRFFQEHLPEEPCDISTTTPTPHDGMPSHEHIVCNDGILRDLSTVQNSHPNVAQVYGWGREPSNRFMVFKAGFLSDDILDKLPGRIPNFARCAFKLLDAIQHLRQLGITWEPQVLHTFQLDEHLKPTIGLNDDLRRINAGDDPVDGMRCHISALTMNISHASQQYRMVSSTDIRTALAGLIDKRLDGVLGKFDGLTRRRHVISKSDFASTYTLSGDNINRLRLLMEQVSRDRDQSDIWPWPQLLFMLSTNRSCMRQQTILAVYKAWSDWSDCLQGGSLTTFFFKYGRWTMIIADSILVQCVGEDPGRIVCDTYTIDIPDSACKNIRQTLGVPAPLEGTSVERIVSTSDWLYCIPL